MISVLVAGAARAADQQKAAQAAEARVEQRAGQAAPRKVLSPSEVIGFELGADYKLADYAQVLRYFQALDADSDRVVLEEIGRTTLGKTMVVAVISSEENLKNRVIRIGLDEVAGMSQSSVYTRLDLRVREVKGKNVYTNLIGHELIPGYVKTIIRRRKSLITSVADATTTDGKKLRMKYLIVTGNRVSDKVKTMVRNEITKELLEAASTTDFASIMQELIFGKIQKRIYAKIKMFAPIKRIEIRRTELVETFA